MPLIVHKKVLDSCEIGIWDITEPLSFFEENLQLTEMEQAWLNETNSKRKKEWLSSRYVIQTLFSKNKPLRLFKDENGKPHIVNSEDFISISHSFDRVAVCRAPLPCGIDIQREVSRIKMIQHKFLSEKELSTLPAQDGLKVLHLFWSAKEAIYKAYGRKKVSLRQHIFVNSTPKSGVGTGHLERASDKRKYSLWFDFVDNYSLAIAQENS